MLENTRLVEENSVLLSLQGESTIEITQLQNALKLSQASLEEEIIAHKVNSLEIANLQNDIEAIIADKKKAEFEYALQIQDLKLKLNSAGEEISTLASMHEESFSRIEALKFELTKESESKNSAQNNIEKVEFEKKELEVQLANALSQVSTMAALNSDTSASLSKELQLTEVLKLKLSQKESAIKSASEEIERCKLQMINDENEISRLSVLLNESEAELQEQFNVLTSLKALQEESDGELKLLHENLQAQVVENTRLLTLQSKNAVELSSFKMVCTKNS
jgi:chromosome segregation ATPase